MRTAVVTRLSVAGVLLLVMGGLAVAHGSLDPAPAAGAYPSAEVLAEGYDRFLGKRVAIGGTVVATDPVTLRTTTAAGMFEVTVTNVTRPVAPGDDIRVFGRAREGRVIEAARVVAVGRANLLYMYGVSTLAACWVLLRGVRHWRVDLETWVLEPRSEPLSYGRALRRLREVVSDAVSFPGGR